MSLMVAECAFGVKVLLMILGIAAVFAAVGGINLVIDVVASVNFHKGSLFVDAACLNMAFVACHNTTKPVRAAPVHGSDVEIVPNPDDPNRSRLPQRTVAPE